MANVGTAPAGKTLIGQGDTTSSKFADIGTDSGLTEHGVLLAQGASAFTATAEGVDGSLLIGATGADPAMALPTSINDTVTFHPTANGLGFEDRRWLTAFVVDPSASVGERGTYQTIAAANAVASSGDTIFFRPGTYTEDWTAKPGVNYTSFTGEGSGQVTIVGKCSASGTGTSVISNIELETNGDFVAEITGANATNLMFNNCTLTLSDNTGFSNTGSGASTFRFNSCTINANTTGISYFSCTNGTLFLTNCIMNNQGGGTTASTFSGTGIFIRWCYLGLPVTVSGAAIIEVLSSQWDTENATALNINSTATGNIVNYSFLNTGTATPITIGTGATLITPVVNLRHTNATAISGLGTLVYGTINQSSTVGAISPSAVTTKATYQGELKLNTGATINEISTDGTLAGNSDTAVPTEQAVKTYVDGAVGGGGASSTSEIYFWDDFMSVVDIGIDPATVSTHFITASVINGLVGTDLEANGDIKVGVSSNTSAAGQIYTTGGVAIGSGEIDINMYLKISAASDATNRYILYFGLGDITGSNAEFSNGCYFKYSDNINSGNFQVVTANGGVRTTNNTAVAPATSYDTYRIVINAAGSSVSFYQNDVEVAGSPITTNLPSLAYPFVKISRAAGTSNRHVYLDYYSLRQTLTTPRS